MKTVTLKRQDPVTLDVKIVRKNAIQYYQSKLSSLWGRIKELQNSSDPDRFYLIGILDEEYRSLKSNLIAIIDN